MASIVSDPGGRKRIQFSDRDGSRKTIRLGKTSTRQADAFRVKVEALVTCNRFGSHPDDEVARWAAGLDDLTHKRVAAVGLLRPRGQSASKLGDFLTSFFDRMNVKPGTAIAYGHSRRCLLEHFGEARPLRDISADDAEGFRSWLKAQGLAQATISRRITVCKAVFDKALRWKRITENPFDEVQAGDQKNESRKFFVAREATTSVMDACPDKEWRAIVALSRYGGVRVPSEILPLKWTDVNWDRGRILVTSPKTAHHKGKGSRVIPLYPELVAPLREVFESAEPGTEFIITRYRQSNCNLRTSLMRIIRRAGVAPWPKLFQNMRSSRQTELSHIYPSKTVAEWMGNSERVADDHYNQMLSSDYDRAAGKSLTLTGEAVEQKAQ